MEDRAIEPQGVKGISCVESRSQVGLGQKAVAMKFRVGATKKVGGSGMFPDFGGNGY